MFGMSEYRYFVIHHKSWKNLKLLKVEYNDNHKMRRVTSFYDNGSAISYADLGQDKEYLKEDLENCFENGEIIEISESEAALIL